MKRLLCIVGGMNAGGAETFLMKLYRCLDKTRYQMDFAVAIDTKGFYDDEILNMGGNIYHITPKTKGIYKNFTDIKRLVRMGGYKYVLRTSQHSLSALELYAAKKGGAKVRAFRSSNSKPTSNSMIQMLLHKACMFMPLKFANVYIAPSTVAARFMFGKRALKRNQVCIINNGLDIHRFSFSVSEREKIRKEFNIQSKMIIGHIGRFNRQKNHEFILETFRCILNFKKNSILLMVGSGELIENIKEKAKELDIYDKCIFAGVRYDIPALLSAMDVFIMPSFYEGMPNTVIEAQSTGLPCVLSDTITKEANITGLVEYMTLKNPDDWARKILSLENFPRVDMSDCLIENCYDIESVVEKFTEIIFTNK